MMQRKWFKIFVWFAATASFFSASAIIVSSFGPGATQAQVMSSMSGMMKAMHSSLMGFSMGIEHDPGIKLLIWESSIVLVPLMILAVIAGIFIRIRGNNDGG